MTEFSKPDEYKVIKDSLNQIEFPLVLDYISKYSYSELGKDIILNSEPTEDIFWLIKEHNQLEEMIEILTLKDYIPYEGISDVKPYVFKAQVQNAALNSNEILSTRDFIRSSRLIKSYFRNKTEAYPELSEETNLLYENRLLEKHIDEAIDDTGNIKDTASRELQRIRREILEVSARLRSRMQRILKKVSEDSLLQDDFVSVREGRFVIPVKAENKRQIPGIIHGVSQTGSTVFLEPSEIIEMNNDLSLLLNEEKREIYKILQNLTAEIGTETNPIIQSVYILAHFDSIIAKSKYALDFGGIKPKILNENLVFMNQVRHPLLVHTKGKNKVIPLSIEFSQEKRGHLISGPNAGGKTVALKSIGLNIAMALSGIYPFGEVSTNYRSIYSAIGDNQSIENDLSTFSSQMLKLKRIIDNCTNQSLILVDEIGSGTDPQEGSALAAGILDSFIEIKLFFVATTHQSSLKSYALSRDVIENASLEFDQNKLQPTYRFLQGIPGNSYAFILAESIGMSKHILNRAQTYLGTKQVELEESIRVLQNVRQQVEDLKAQNEQEKFKIEKIKKDYETRLSDFKVKRNLLMNEARSDANDILSRANSLIENTIKEIKEDKKAANVIKKDFYLAKQDIVSNIISKEETTANDIDEFKIGDFVKSRDSETIGNILDIDNNNQTALIDFNGLKFKLSLEQLIAAKKPTTKKSSSIADNIKFDSGTFIDLRGKRVDECLRLVDEFISDAVLGNVPRLSIIHGKGTGALRAAVQDLLRSHPSITKFRNGTLTEGGDGVTIVEF